MAEVNIDATIAKYDHFINDVLREDLRILESKLQHINAEISDLIQQRHSLKVLTDKTMHPNGFKTQLNVGCNFFMEASVTDTSKLIINIGSNIFLEFTLPEANKYLDARIKAYEEKSEELRDKAVAVKAHIKLMLFNIDELQKQSYKS